MNKPRVEKLINPIHAGDWHDKPCRWNVIWGTKNQMFRTKKDAERYARLWLKVGGDELAAIREFQTL